MKFTGRPELGPHTPATVTTTGLLRHHYSGDFELIYYAVAKTGDGENAFGCRHR